MGLTWNVFGALERTALSHAKDEVAFVYQDDARTLCCAPTRRSATAAAPRDEPLPRNPTRKILKRKLRPWAADRIVLTSNASGEKTA
jgi:hypothetical protein